MSWQLSSSSDPRALEVVDGTGQWSSHGPHYSRRTPGSKTFTGVGREVVLLHPSGAVWAVVLQKTPAPRGSGSSRGRSGYEAPTRWVWRNMLFRNLGPELSSGLIVSATAETYLLWADRYSDLPEVRLRTEIDVRKVASPNPGYCYKCAGWTDGHMVRGKLYLYAPEHNP